jgi:sigma-B regulation protein RsbU (phosphoserine phosphatase)
MQSTQQRINYIRCLVEEIMHVTEETLQAEASSVLLLDHQEQEMCFRFVHGPAEGILSEATLGIDTGVAGWVARNQEPVIVNDPGSDPRFCGDIDDVTGFRTKAIICAPLVARGKLLGVIEVLNKTDGSDFDERDLHTLAAVARTAAIAIELKMAEEAFQESAKRHCALVNSLSDEELKLFGQHPSSS